MKDKCIEYLKPNTKYGVFCSRAGALYDEADGTPWRPTMHSRVCSDHFITKRKNEATVHPDYVPTVFPRNGNKVTIASLLRLARFQRLRERNFKKGSLKHLQADDEKQASTSTVDDRQTEESLVVQTEQLEQDLLVGAVPSSNSRLPTTAAASPASTHEDSCPIAPISTVQDSISNVDRDRVGLNFKMAENPWSTVDAQQAGDDLITGKDSGPFFVDENCDTMSYKETIVDNKRLCRICGQLKSDLTSLYGPSAVEMGLLRKIEDCLRIKIESTSCLPTEICRGCISNLDTCDQFVTLARNANIRLHEMYEDQMETNETTMICRYCDKKFRSPKLLNLHCSTHATASVFQCEICGNQFKNAEGLICHKRTHRALSHKKKHVCSTCDKTFRSRSDLLEHTNSHLGLKPYSCRSCGKVFHSGALLRQHSLVHRSAGSLSKNRCFKCDKWFARHADLRTHMRRHEVGRTFKCGVCQLSLPSIGALLSHRKQHQTSSKTADSESKQLPAAVSKNLLQCKDCDKQFSGRSGLAYHRKTTHETDKPYLCHICDKALSSEALKRQHQQTHSQNEQYPCTMCDKSLKSANALKQHIKQHSATFECEHCHKTFNRKGNLQMHVRRVHTTERPFVCAVCARTFAEKNDMQKHITRQHSLVYCQLCCQTFTDNAALDEHNDKQHNVMITV
ncbi:zinc finger protein 354B [Nilaparvata lugens]|uniref:zinc finger protein 354B n=1 Tax=Nilaparvata lugens TaxID=108931 RepID=UPI000B97D05A|nr:zinc finger protein 354B [Nilaparvata lugens]